MPTPVEFVVTLTDGNTLHILPTTGVQSTTLDATGALYVVTNGGKGRHVCVRRGGVVIADIRRPAALWGKGPKPPTVRLAHWTRGPMAIKDWVLDTQQGKAVLVDNELYTWVETRDSGAAHYAVSRLGLLSMDPRTLTALS